MIANGNWPRRQGSIYVKRDLVRGSARDSIRVLNAEPHSKDFNGPGSQTAKDPVTGDQIGVGNPSNALYLDSAGNSVIVPAAVDTTTTHITGCGANHLASATGTRAAGFVCLVNREYNYRQQFWDYYAVPREWLEASPVRTGIPLLIKQ